MRVLIPFALSLSAALAFLACSGDESETTGGSTLCSPNENYFCKCRGGEGTKACKPDGSGYEECVNLDGACQEVVSTTSGSGEPGATSGDPTTGATSGGGGGTGGKGLLEPCAGDDECATGMCPMGFCTKDCANYMECAEGDVSGECVRLEGGTVQWCVQYCADQTDCAAFGPDSMCGFAPTLDGVGIQVTGGPSGYPVCADWDTDLALPPDTTKCPQAGWESDDDAICHLGLAGVERVCAFGQCTDGCHVDDDCPANAPNCSSSESLGSCQ